MSIPRAIRQPLRGPPGVRSTARGWALTASHVHRAEAVRVESAARDPSPSLIDASPEARADSRPPLRSLAAGLSPGSSFGLAGWTLVGHSEGCQPLLRKFLKNLLHTVSHLRRLDPNPHRVRDARKRAPPCSQVEGLIRRELGGFGPTGDPREGWGRHHETPVWSRSPVSTIRMHSSPVVSGGVPEGTWVRGYARG